MFKKFFVLLLIFLVGCTSLFRDQAKLDKDLLNACVIDPDDLHAIKTLVAAGANVNARDKKGKTALDMLAENCPENKEIKNILLKAGAKTNKK